MYKKLGIIVFVAAVGLMAGGVIFAQAKSAAPKVSDQGKLSVIATDGPISNLTNGAKSKRGFVCGQSVLDSDGNSYSTVTVGAQCWMGENLRTKKRPNGQLLTNLSNGSERDCIAYGTGNSGSIRGTEADCSAGYTLYTWDAAMNGSTTEGAQGLCPTGFHVPTASDWSILETGLTDPGQSCDPNRVYPTSWQCLGAGTKLKAGGASGLNITLAGLRNPSGNTFGNRDLVALTWTSTEMGSTAAYTPGLHLSNLTVWRGGSMKTAANSLRCIMN